MNHRQIRFLVNTAATRIWGRLYFLTVMGLYPLNFLLSRLFRKRFTSGSVVHIGEMRHLQHSLVQALKERGFDATYVACGSSRHWSDCDVHLPHLKNPFHAAIRDTFILWNVVARHEIIHCHCMMGVSHYQWEFPLLKGMGRKIVAHWRGCEARERDKNMALHPVLNICQDCDYTPDYLCAARENVRRRKAARLYTDAHIVTTPDIKDFYPGAVHLPLLQPPDLPKGMEAPVWNPDCERPFKIVHITNQPGIEATEIIKGAVDRLVRAGWSLSFVHLTGVPHSRVLDELADADISIGKLKMGYYANSQIESMAMGVPTITWIRPDLMTEELNDSGLIFSTLDGIADTIEGLLRDPEKLNAARRKSLASVGRLHGADRVVATLRDVYERTLRSNPSGLS